MKYILCTFLFAIQFFALQASGLDNCGNSLNEISKDRRKHIGHQIVEGLLRTNDELNANRSIELADAKLMIFFQHFRIRDIIGDGFKNVFETKQSNGHSMQIAAPERMEDYLIKRANAESRLSGINLKYRDSDTQDLYSSMARPSYAFLSMNNRSSESLKSYGDTVAVLKDSVKERSTWTPQDSLNWQERAFTFQHQDRIPESKSFYEAQIWGGIDLRDIKEWWVTEEVVRYYKYPVEEMKKTGIPIYVYEPVLDEFGNEVSRKKLRLVPFL